MSYQAQHSVEQEKGPDSELVDEVVGGDRNHQVDESLGDDDRSDVGDEFGRIHNADWSQSKVEDNDVDIDEADEQIVVDVLSQEVSVAVH